MGAMYFCPSASHSMMTQGTAPFGKINETRGPKQGMNGKSNFLESKTYLFLKSGYGPPRDNVLSFDVTG